MPLNRLDPREHVLALTSFAAGTVDVIGFAKLGGVFPSAMTGNLAFLALYSATGLIHAAIGSLTALLGFSLGVAAATLLTHRLAGHAAITPLVSAETVLLFLAAALWFALPHQRGELLIATLSTAMGVQSVCGKKINLSNIPTVVFTSTLTNIVSAVTEALARREKLGPDTIRQLVSFSLYFIGAFAAGLLVYFDVTIVILLPALAAAAALAAHAREPAEARRQTASR